MIPKSCEAVQALDMRAGIVVNVTRADRLRLEAIVLDRGAPTSLSFSANFGSVDSLNVRMRCGARSDRHREKKPTGPVECWRKRPELACDRCNVSSRPTNSRRS